MTAETPFEVLACPRCGYTATHKPVGASKIFKVVCSECSWEGGASDNLTRAYHQWNRSVLDYHSIPFPAPPPRPTKKTTPSKPPKCSKPKPKPVVVTRRKDYGPARHWTDPTADDRFELPSAGDYSLGGDGNGNRCVRYPGLDYYDGTPFGR